MPKIDWRPERNALAAILENPGVPPTIRHFGGELLRSIDSLAGSYETFYPSINDAGRAAAELQYAADFAARESDAADSFDSAAVAVHKTAVAMGLPLLPTSSFDSNDPEGSLATMLARIDSLLHVTDAPTPMTAAQRFVLEAHRAALPAVFRLKPGAAFIPWQTGLPRGTVNRFQRATGYKTIAELETELLTLLARSAALQASL